ncbi:MAG: nitronate monooxygenase family protein [Prevotellaceae bacterium]|jgi:NAD(P)H-dependent flavin oxidoreductase YrpB (nitropropane dioxygenase family)|nr:nitronate monooxygenase family protein [Prevotellaceae bacterium]
MKSLKIGNLTLSLPIIQGGMGVGVSLSGLAGAVANENGVGVIASAGIGLLYRHLSKDYLKASILGLKEEILKAREKSKGVIGVNIMVAMSNFADMVKTAINEKADIIFSGAGLPLDLPSYLPKNSSTKLVPIVSSGRAASLICEKWQMNYNYLPDAIVVEGPKAGGHLGFKITQILDEQYSLEKLVKDIREKLQDIKDKYGKRISLIAAGGIYTGDDIYKIMKAGADGVQMGSRFVTSAECDASDKFKQSYIEAEEEDIEIVQSPVGMPGRAIKNSFLDKVAKGEKQPSKCPYRCIKSCDISKSPYCIIVALYNALKGNFNGGYAFAGVNAFKAKKIESMKQIVSDLQQEYSLAEIQDRT